MLIVISLHSAQGLNCKKRVKWPGYEQDRSKNDFFPWLCIVVAHLHNLMNTPCEQERAYHKEKECDQYCLVRNFHFEIAIQGSVSVQPSTVSLNCLAIHRTFKRSFWFLIWLIFLLVWVRSSFVFWFSVLTHHLGSWKSYLIQLCISVFQIYFPLLSIALFDHDCLSLKL